MPYLISPSGKALSSLIHCDQGNWSVHSVACTCKILDHIPEFVSWSCLVSTSRWI